MNVKRERKVTIRTAVRSAGQTILEGKRRLPRGLSPGVAVVPLAPLLTVGVRLTTVTRLTAVSLLTAVPRLTVVSLLMAVPLVTLAAGARAQERPQQEAASQAVDRWLVSDPFETQGSSPEDALQELFLTAEPSSQFFPDRDLEVDGSYWHLVRENGASEFEVDSLFPERTSPAVIYAHTYIRVPEDRTVRLTWRGPACGRIQARLNDQLLEPRVATGRNDGFMAVRLAAGWNTLLLKMSGMECPYRFGARLEASTDSSPFPTRKGKAAGQTKEAIRIQASRPPGVRRSYPAAWVGVEPSDTAVRLSWAAGQSGLQASLDLGFTAWGTNAAPELGERGRRVPADTTESREPPASGRQGPPVGRRPSRSRGATPRGRPGPSSTEDTDLRDRLIPAPPPPEPAPASVQLEVKVGGNKVARTADLAPPGRGEQVSIPLMFSTLRKAALSSDGVQMQLRWPTDTEDRKRVLEEPISADLLLRSLHGSIRLSGWSRRDASGGDRTIPKQATALKGEWTLPGSLSGFTLELSTREAPGRYRLDGELIEPHGDFLRLCGPCRQNSHLTLEVEPEGPWTGSPWVRIVESGFPEAGTGSPDATEWLRALSGGGNRNYLKLAADYAGP